MYQFIVKPLEKKVDLQICIPVYKREIELIALVKSIRKSLKGINYNIYFLLNGATENAKNLVTEKLALTENSGIISFEKNIEEDIFIWPFFNLPKGLTWVIGDDDFIEKDAYDAVLNSMNYDLTILNYDLYDHNLDKKLYPSYLERYFKKEHHLNNIKFLFSNLGERLSFISSVIIDTNIISSDIKNHKPKSFQFASLIYYSILKNKEKVKIYFESNICLKQRGNNISKDDKLITDNIFINEIRLFYLSMIYSPTYRIPAFFKLTIYTILHTPRLLIRSRIEDRSPDVKGFFVIDQLYLTMVSILIRFIPKSFFKYIRNLSK